MNNALAPTSKLISLVLRHKPESVGLTLDEGGWASVDQLISCLNAAGKTIDRDLLEKIVSTSDKKRFIFSDDGTRIRSNQGHSVNVDLGLTPTNPPARLFHGTATRFLPAIEASGLHTRGRHHVHLSADMETARSVGNRHGRGQSWWWTQSECRKVDTCSSGQRTACG
jgi:putative RNA 2'-phosphotransferase